MRSFSDTDFDPTSSRLLKLLCVKKLLKSPFQINRRSCYNRLFGLVDEFFFGVLVRSEANGKMWCEIFRP